MELPPETITNLIPPLQRSPPLQNQTLIPVPPALNPAASPESDADYNHLPTPLPLPSHPSEPEEAVTFPVSTPIPQSHDLPVANSAPPITSGFGSKLINTIRRAPSMSGVRGTIGASLGHVPNGGERRSTSEKTPRSSFSTLSFPPGESSQEQPPPLPPLPPDILNRSNSLNVTPMLNTPVTDPKKEKDKIKPTRSGWFNKNKKNLLVGEKETSVPDPSPGPSQAIKGDEHYSLPRFTSMSNRTSPTPMSSSPNGAVPTDFTDHQPVDSRSEVFDRDQRPNGYVKRPPPLEPTPWPPSTTTRPSHLHSRSSTLLSDPHTGSSASSLSRKPSLALADRFRSSIDRKKSIDSVPSPTARPMTAPSSPGYKTTDFNSRTLPPLPPTPKINSHRTNMSLSNGQFFTAEAQNTVKGKARSSDDTSASDRPAYSRSMTMSESPASIAASVGQNTSIGSMNSATSNIRRATRKLSLGFGKRDKDRDKDKDRERDRVSPSTFINRF